MSGADTRARFCAVFGRPGAASGVYWNWYGDEFEGTFEEKQEQLEDQLLVDAVVYPASAARTVRDRVQAALASAGEVLKTKPDDLDSRLARAMAYFRLRENQKALDDLKVVVGKRPWAISPKECQIIALAQLGNTQEARSELAKYEKESIHEASKLYLAAVVAAELGEPPDGAFAAIEEAIQKQPKDADLHYYAACAYARASAAILRTDNAKARQFADRCLQFLKVAVQNDDADFAQMDQDADLDLIREHPAFADIMKAGHADRRYCSLWSRQADYEALPLCGLDPASHLQKCRELMARGYRPVSWSVTRTAPIGPLVTASVWHRPVVSEDRRINLPSVRQGRRSL